MRLLLGTGAALLTVVLGALFASPDRTSDVTAVDQWRLSDTSAGAIRGEVHDLEGTPRAGVTVELLRDGQVVASTKTDGNGRFGFERVSEGIYEVRAAIGGVAGGSVRLAIGHLPVPPLKVILGVDADPSLAGSQTAVGGLTNRQHGAKAADESLNQSAPASAEMRHVAPLAPPPLMRGGFPFNTATYDRIDDNSFRRVSDSPLSTFSIDVDTASYSNVRRFLNQGALPPADAVRVEELINYFRFPHAEADGDAPLAISTDVGPCPWNPQHRLALIGVQARKERREAAPARNLVFLLDVSGSMMPPDRLPLVKTAMRMLVDTLTANDRVAIVVYAGASGLVLPSTRGDRKEAVHRAIAELEAGGSTNGAAGIQLAYDTAASPLVKGGINRVILATDGDFNVGVTSQRELIRLIEQQRERGIFLSVLGVGQDNLKDSTMEKLADRGNGNYSYLDSLHEARRVLVAEAGSTLVTVAKDVKIQVEFNPGAVGAYRLVGYENRILNSEDFNDDRKDAGELGAGHTVTALYELIPPGAPLEGARVDPLKYQEAQRATASSHEGELMTVKIRYKEPDDDSSRLLSVAVRDDAGRPGCAPRNDHDARTPHAECDADMNASLGFAAAVAEFGMLLRDSEFKGEATWDSAQRLARQHRGDDPDGYRAEFVRLVDLAAALAAQKERPVVESR